MNLATLFNETYRFMADIGREHGLTTMEVAQLVNHHRIPTELIGGRRMVVRAAWDAFVLKARAEGKKWAQPKQEAA